MNNRNPEILALESRMQRAQLLRERTQGLSGTAIVLGIALLLGGVWIAKQNDWKPNQPNAFLRGLLVYGVALVLPLTYYFGRRIALGGCEHTLFAEDCQSVDKS